MRKSKQEIRDKAADNIGRSMKRLLLLSRTVLEARLEGRGVTLAQMRMLGALVDAGDGESSISAAELARLCGVTPQSMQALVTRAEREGWIVRRPSPWNRRVLSATLTERGRRAYRQGKDHLAEISRALWSGATVEDMDRLNRILSQAADRLQPMQDDLRGKKHRQRLD